MYRAAFYLPEDPERLDDTREGAELKAEFASDRLLRPPKTRQSATHPFSAIRLSPGREHFRGALARE